MKTKIPTLDSVTWTAIHQCIADARTQGLDLAEELNRRGLILSPAARKEIRVREVDGLVAMMKLWSDSDFLARLGKRGRAASPADMHQAIVGWGEEVLQAIKES